MRSKSYIFVLQLIVWLSLFPNHIRAQAFRDISYQIADFKSAKESANFLDSLDVLLRQSNWPDANFGMSIYLEYSVSQKKVFLFPENEGITLSDFLAELERHISGRPNKIFPLFLTFNGIQQHVERTFLESPLGKNAYYQEEGQVWPNNIRSLISSKKNLVLFALNDLEKSSTIFNSAKGDIAELPLLSFANPEFNGDYKKGSIQNELLMLRHLRKQVLDSIQMPENWSDFNEQDLIPNYIKSCWMMTGKRPNFIFYDTIYLCRTVMWLEELTNAVPYVNGNIENNGNLLTGVKWEYYQESTTNHLFSFPFIDDILRLKPYNLGMSFEPASSEVKITDGLAQNVLFKAVTLEPEDNLSAFYPFNSNLDNVVNPSEKIINNGCTFHTSVEKGDVLKIDSKAHLVLAPSERYGIINNSLTIACFIKVLRQYGRDAMIVGTSDEIPRKGLHFELRDNIPYAGFFNNDVSAESPVKSGDWNHLAFRYDKIEKRQSLFLNGELIASIDGHSSFIGESRIMVGSALGIDDSFDGYLDDLGIWARALSNEEIRILYTRGINYNNVRRINGWNRKYSDRNSPTVSLIYWGLALFLVFAIIIFLLFFKMKPRRRPQKTSVPVRQTSNDIRNAIFFFGNFTVFDKDGKNISSSFPPKVKELFLLICFYTERSNKGISSEQLTSIIWEGFSSTKASNNRGVTFNKLRKALTNVEGVSINFENEHWRILFDSNVQCDYITAIRFLHRMDDLDVGEFKEFYQIVKRGSLLHRLNWKWLEEFKDDLTFDIVDALLIYANLLSETKNSKDLYTISKHVLSIDDLNEQALQLQIQVLFEQGNINKAQFIVDRFKERYLEGYGEPYPFTIKELLKKKIS